MAEEASQPVIPIDMWNLSDYSGDVERKFMLLPDDYQSSDEEVQPTNTPEDREDESKNPCQADRQ